jgi:hypothetical protein
MSHEAYKAFDRDTSTYWESEDNAGPHTLGYQFSTAETVTKYAVTANANKYPSSWTFEGSNDDVTWTTLDTQTGQVFTALEKKLFSLANTTSYLYYQLNISATIDWNDASISYDSQQMSVNGSQTLSVDGVPAEASSTCTWEITSGGGTLDTYVGTSVVYTAPATNANCLSNPTITLSCGGNVIDTLQIAVNGDTSDSVASVGRENCDPTWPGPATTTFFRRCNGSNYYISRDSYRGPGCYDDCNGVSCGCRTIGYEGVTYPCIGCECTIDVRTEALLATGCCPANLL